MKVCDNNYQFVLSVSGSEEDRHHPPPVCGQTQPASRLLTETFVLLFLLLLPAARPPEISSLHWCLPQTSSHPTGWEAASVRPPPQTSAVWPPPEAPPQRSPAQTGTRRQARLRPRCHGDTGLQDGGGEPVVCPAGGGVSSTGGWRHWGDARPSAEENQLCERFTFRNNQPMCQELIFYWYLCPTVCHNRKKFSVAFSDYEPPFTPHPPTQHYITN